MKNLTMTIQPQGTQPAVALLVDPSHLPQVPSKSFQGEWLESTMVYGDNPTLYIGVGDVTKLTPLSYKELGGAIAKAFDKEKITRYQVDAGQVPVGESYYLNITQGLAIGSYEFSLKSQQKEIEPREIVLVGEGTEAEHAQLEEGLILAEGVEFVRNVTNLPANHLRPEDFAKKIDELLTPLGIEVEVLNDKELRKKGLNGIYLIGDSSDFDPCMVIMRYKGSNDKKTALVGKGITYDTGGSDLKSDMKGMQGDMAGAAAVVGTLYALAKNKVEANIVGIVPLAENRLGDDSLVAGDVYTSYGGLTVEVLNTDAEGRLVLADAVAYAVKDELADEVLDIATLTGAAVRSFGYGVTPVVTNNQEIWGKLEEAAKITGERFTQLPNYPEYHKVLESQVADLKNLGDPEGGSITGGLFVGKFAEEKPWIHLDIAGTSWVKKPLFAHQSIGATGTAVDTMYFFCKK